MSDRRFRLRLTRHVATTFDIPAERAHALVSGMRERRSRLDFVARVVLFALATTLPGRWLMPVAAAKRAVRPFVFKMLERPGDIMFFLGEVEEVTDDPCRGLIAE